MTTTPDVKAQNGLELAWARSGVAPEDRGRLFERFYRGARTPSAEGCGLGLSIVQRIAALHRADVRLEERIDGGGLQAVVRFPAA